jgi:hypothetical protein
MDVARVDRIARRHKELATTGGQGTLDEANVARHHEAEGLNRLFREIQAECEAYCRSYNDAFGATRVRWESHSDTVVIRSQLDPEDTLVFLLVLPTDTKAGRIEARRYHYREQPVQLPVDVRRTDDEDVTLTLHGRNEAPADMVLDLLTTFTEHIARTEWRPLADRQQPAP